MASTRDLCWSKCEDLFSEVDLDSLYSQQKSALASGKNRSYPYAILLHTGKITISVDLGHCIEEMYGMEYDQGVDSARIQ
jgi:hypothetical protein